MKQEINKVNNINGLVQDGGNSIANAPLTAVLHKAIDIILIKIMSGYLVRMNQHMPQQGFSDMSSDWLAAVLPANQKPCVKILVNWHGF